LAKTLARGTRNEYRSTLRKWDEWGAGSTIEELHRKPGEQRDVAGRHYLTKAEINALYFATHQMKRPGGWKNTAPVGRHWRSALVVFFNYGLDTSTVWKSAPFHEPTGLSSIIRQFSK
jgi:hypothetical protein